MLYPDTSHIHKPIHIAWLAFDFVFTCANMLPTDTLPTAQLPTAQLHTA